MQNKRPRGGSGSGGKNSGGKKTGKGTPSPEVQGARPAPVGPAPQGPAPVGGKPGRKSRPKRVRNRLVASVAAVGLLVLAAGAPSLLTASDELTTSQRLLDLAELNKQALALAHSLADERDDATGRKAAAEGGKSRDKGTPRGDRTSRVDRQIAELTGPGGDSADLPDGLRRALAKVAGLRAAADSASVTPLQLHRAYSTALDELRSLARDLARRTPPRAGGSGTAPAALGNAVEQAAATRGLLLAALAVPRGKSTAEIDPDSGLLVRVESGSGKKVRDELSAAAQQARHREQAALADFALAAPEKDRDAVSVTVTGPEVTTAEGYLKDLTDESTLSAADRKLGAERVGAALTARVDRMRGAESALASAQAENLAALRDDDVSALELRIGLLAACFLLAVGISTAVARTLTQPLAVLRLGAARLAGSPETEEPVRYTGRNDEFAQAVRSLNGLHSKLLELNTRTEKLAGDRAHLVGQRETLDAQRRTLASENSQLAAEQSELLARVQDTTARLDELRATVHSSFVKLSLRTLSVVERQLAVIESLEEREQDPDRLATLFKLDHMATVMRRHGENLLVLAGTDHGVAHTGPVPLVDVLRAAISEIERYERVTLQALPPHAQVAGYAADDLSHLLAELLENGTSFSPPDAHVKLSGWLLESGEIMLSVQDHGIGMTPERLADLNSRLADPATYTAPGEGDGLGLQVAALLAARHGVRIQVRAQEQGGVTSVVVLPQALLQAEPPAVPSVTETPHSLPGSVAEANSNVLPGRGPAAAVPDRAPDQDPLIAVAEKAVEEAEAEAARAERAAHVRAPDESSVRNEPAPVREEAPEVDQPTREIRLPRPAAEPEPAPVVPERKPEPEPVPVPLEPTAPRLTDKGLPKRTPKVVKPTTPAAPPRTGGVDAEALRRRLGGFQLGARNGRRDVEAEIANSGNNEVHGVDGASGEPRSRTTTDRTTTDRADRPTTDRTDRTERPTTDRYDRATRNDQTDTEGDTVEEARS
ncbi:nitrate- and nitrite sensing domain-containing protein [Streptomyces sp. NBC_00237]|uniref:sensor histidine kinase n=1 Tax=Streptomyces sp. NBC_00237 TaxID=2975687 RepID=UPI00225715E2|nr:nitrate- and nitrite sensing domain-containing protein [Streptomyces sp. NBC_00237]MCX5204245.1 nitrate- and nitrite sensing domain-containing protein [Streptomyces sp. NBC_00237]